MATAESLAQIKAVMQEEDNPVEIVVLAADGTSSELVVDHRKIREVLGSLPTFVGSIRKLDVSAVARKDGVGKNNKHVLPKHWDEGIKGTIVLFRTVEEGAMFVPKPFRLADYEAWRAAGGVEEEVEEEDEEDEEGEDGDEDEDEDSGEESDGEEGMDMEQMAEQMASLPEKELKKMLKDMELPVTGTKAELVARIIEQMKADADAAAAEEGDSDDSDEEREAMDVAEVQEKLEACSEVELKKMLKEMKLPTTGKKAELVARIIEQMQKDAAMAEEEGDSEDEAMELAQVQEKLEACSEAELKQMLKDMKLPNKGKKAELVARILEQMQKGAEEEDDSEEDEDDKDDEDDEDDEEEEEAEAEAASKSAGKRARPAEAPSAAKRSAKGKGKK